MTKFISAKLIKKILRPGYNIARIQILDATSVDHDEAMSRLIWIHTISEFNMFISGASRVNVISNGSVILSKRMINVESTWYRPITRVVHNKWPC